VTVLEQVKRDWKWSADGPKDRWVMPPLSGPFKGDCEEFALAVLLREKGAEDAMWDALESGEARLLHVTSERGNGHAVLWFYGKGYVDSIHQSWRGDLLFSHNFDYSPGQIKRKLDGKKVRGPANKKMLALAALVGVGTLFFAFGM